VKCKFYFNHDFGYDTHRQNGCVEEADRSMKMSELGLNMKYTEVSFMIFRTGSCLIVGNCSEKILTFIYDFIKKILSSEYSQICVENDGHVVKNKKTKLRKRTVQISDHYLQQNIIS
jgi:hypothetical protein